MENVTDAPYQDFRKIFEGAAENVFRRRVEKRPGRRCSLKCRLTGECRPREGALPGGLRTPGRLWGPGETRLTAGQSRVRVRGQEPRTRSGGARLGEGQAWRGDEGRATGAADSREPARGTAARGAGTAFEATPAAFRRSRQVLRLPRARGEGPTWGERPPTSDLPPSTHSLPI